MYSFLPDGQSDRCNLSCQGEASHRWLHAFGEQALVEIVQRSLLAAGHTRRTLEDGFHIMVMILIEPTQLLWFLATLHLPAHVTVLGTVARLDRQTAVGPQLPLGAETMRVWISAMSSAARIGPIEGTWRSNLVALCFRLSANRSFRTAWRNPRRASSCW